MKQGDRTEITIETVERAIRSMKYREASGPSGVTAEVTENGTHKVKTITVLLNKCINQ
jgi:hypothetical protein